MRDATPERILQLRVVDPAMGSGAFLVAACRYLAAAYEAALVRDRRLPRRATSATRERVAIRRTIAERCLYGVDLNPMAVQLARLSLWLATLAADRPLSFLDHHLQVGDSLLGAWLASLRQPPITRPRARRTPHACRCSTTTTVDDALREALPVRFSLEATPERHARAGAREGARARRADAPRRRAVAVEAGRGPVVRRLVLAGGRRARPPSAFGALSDAILTGRGALPAQIAEPVSATRPTRSPRARRFFHWELEFPEVFFDRDGTRLPDAGFDAVIGNPPWDMIRADAGPADARARARSDIAPVAAVHARRRRLHARSRTATRTAISCSSSARWR